MRWGRNDEGSDVMLRTFLALLAICAVALPATSAADDKKKKGKMPDLTLRAPPRFSFSPARIIFTAELKGGDDIEAVYCPEVEWDWGDGAKSISEGDCDPWEPGTEIERRFTGRHEYRYAGRFRVRVTLRKSGDIIRQQSIVITVRPGIGDPGVRY